MAAPRLTGAIRRDQRRVIRLAHRGDWRRAPENTLAAFEAALRIVGCDGVEFDVRRARDGVPVVIHDDTLERVQGRPDRVADLTAAQLAQHGVPSLAAVLDLVPRSRFVDVELKDDPGPTAIEVVAAARSAGASLQRAVISSFEPDTLERVASARPGWRRWLNAEDLEPATLRVAIDLGCAGISADWRAIDATSVSRAGAAGLEVAAWTVRRTSTYRRLMALGVVAVCAEAAALDRGPGT